MFGCRGCVGEEEEPCLVLDHHPGDAVDQYAGGEDQHNLFSNFYIFMFVYFCQEGPGSVEWSMSVTCSQLYCFFIQDKYTLLIASLHFHLSRI